MDPDYPQNPVWSKSKTCVFHFENFEFQPAARRLLVDGVDQVLGGRAFDLLHALVENHDRVVSKNELYERVWPGLAVEPGNLQVQVWALRKALGHHMIATVARRGYRFMPAVKRVSVNTASAKGAAPPLAPATTCDLVDTLVQDMADHRLVTLTGLDAGVSDRLVQAAAQLMATHLAGRIWQIDAVALTGRRPGHLHPTTPEGQAALRQASDRLRTLLPRIARRPAVLVVLNSHLAEGLPEAVTRLLDDSSGLRLLVSTPQALALPGEKLLTVPADEAESPKTRQEANEQPPSPAGLRWHSRA